eukprot:scaffold8259_cov62-Cyclotella_meneghiniana.AAC.6
MDGRQLPIDHHASCTNCDINIMESCGCEIVARLWQSYTVNEKITSGPIFGCSALLSNTDSRGSARFYRNQSRLPLDDCKTVDENAAMWTYILRLIPKDQQQRVVRKEHVSQLEQNIRDVLEVTMDSLPRMRPKDLTTIIIQLAKIANRVSSKHYKRLSATELALKNILLDEESNPQH